MRFKYKYYISNPFSVIKMYNLFAKNERASEREINSYAFKQLKKLCIYCNEHVPYYTKLFKEIHFDPKNMTDISDFKKIPILDKDIVTSHFKELQSDEIAKMNTVICSTSGSTGTPLRIYLDSNVNKAIFIKLWRLWNTDKNWHIGKTLLSLDGDNTEYAKKKWYFNNKNRFLYFTPFYIKNDNIQMYYELVKKYKPSIMKGYPSAIYLFGKCLEKNGLSLNFSTIFIHSENILDVQKEFFERFFKARVVIQYGNNEKAGLIHSCKCGNLHSQDDYAFHEILDSNGNNVPLGEVGRLVCTNLYNLSMPLLRYDTRDIASFSKMECECGSHFKVVSRIVRRASEVIYTDDDRVISLIDSAFWNSENIDLASIYQPQKGVIIVNIVPGSNFSSKDEEILMSGLRERCGDTMNIEIRKVHEKDIPRTPAGKVKFIVSDIKM